MVSLDTPENVVSDVEDDDGRPCESLRTSTRQSLVDDYVSARQARDQAQSFAGARGAPDQADGGGPAEDVPLEPRWPCHNLTYVQAHTTYVDEIGLRKALKAKIFDSYTKHELDRKAMEAAMDNGEVDPVTVSKYVTERPKKAVPQLHRHGGDGAKPKVVDAKSVKPPTRKAPATRIIEALEGDYMTTRQVAEYFEVNIETIRRLSKARNQDGKEKIKGPCKATKSGSMVIYLFTPEDVEEIWKYFGRNDPPEENGGEGMKKCPT